MPVKAKKKSRARKKASKTSTIKRTLSPKQAGFLTAVRATFANGKVRNVAAACRISHVDQTTHYILWLGQEIYAEEWAKLDDEYQASIRDSVRAETERRGMEGWDEEIIEEEREMMMNPETGKREMMAKKRKFKRTRRFSDTLLALRNNQLFGDARKVEVTGPGGGPVQAETTLRFGAVLDAIKNDKNGDRPNGDS